MKDPERWNHGPWGYTQPWDTRALGPTILDAKEQARWAQVIRLGGLPYIWRELAAPMLTIVYSLMELKPGDKVLVIGESIEPCGFDADIRAMVGEKGEVRCVEILEKARKATADLAKGRCGKIGTWRWDYTENVPDGYFDCVAALQSVQHCDDWREAGADMLRVMKPGRRLVLAEVAMFGTPFWPRLETDLHLQYWVDKLSHFRPLPARETAYYSPEELHTALDPLLEAPQNLEWRGLELFWGRKPAK
jgi:SAM-dependent methyltransferase